MKKFGIVLSLLVLLFSACRKNIDDVTTDIETPTPPLLENYTPKFSLANGDLTGFVYDENKEPIEGAEITLGNFMTITDQFGHFFFTNADMNAKGTLVQIEKEGYFLGSRRFLAVENVENRVNIELITKNFNQSFETDAGGTINLNGGGTVVFSPNSIQKADGTAYTGQVKVASYWMNPTDYNTFNQMPGNLFGVDNRGDEVVLGTMGMIAVELESEAGEPLNILEGQTAKVTTPIPTSLLNNAPNEIPLWSYNEEYGVWVEEGVSRLENGSYVAEVTHFSYWNHDFKDPVIEFTATITDEDGNPLENYMVVIGIPDSWQNGSGYTCEDGTIAGLIPENYILDLEILGVCNEVLYTEEIGPFTGFADLGTIAIPASVLGATTINGELVDCDGNSIQNGVAIIDYGFGSAYEYVEGEAFSFTFSSCYTSDVTVTGYDLTELIQSNPIAATANTVNELGNIDVCDVQILNFINLTVDGVNQLYLNASVADSVSNTLIFQYTQNSSNIFMQFFGNTPGDYSSNHGLSINDLDNGWNFNQETFDVFEVTEYGNIGEPIIGNFSGTLTNFGVQPPVQVSVSGDFNIINQ